MAVGRTEWTRLGRSQEEVEEIAGTRPEMIGPLPGHEHDIHRAWLAGRRERNSVEDPTRPHGCPGAESSPVTVAESAMTKPCQNSIIIPDYTLVPLGEIDLAFGTEAIPSRATGFPLPLTRSSSDSARDATSLRLLVLASLGAHLRISETESAQTFHGAPQRSPYIVSVVPGASNISHRTRRTRLGHPQLCVDTSGAPLFAFCAVPGACLRH
jgi:hypothetical protein